MHNSPLRVCFLAASLFVACLLFPAQGSADSNCPHIVWITKTCACGQQVTVRACQGNDSSHNCVDVFEWIPCCGGQNSVGSSNIVGECGEAGLGPSRATIVIGDGQEVVRLTRLSLPSCKGGVTTLEALFIQ